MAGRDESLRDTTGGLIQTLLWVDVLILSLTVLITIDRTTAIFYAVIHPGEVLGCSRTRCCRTPHRSPTSSLTATIAQEILGEVLPGVVAAAVRVAWRRNADTVIPAGCAASCTRCSSSMLTAPASVQPVAKYR